MPRGCSIGIVAPLPLARPLNAAVWLQQIKKLRPDGQTAKAEEEFTRFRDAYPDYRAPAGPRPADGPTK
jgi:hypothetical protein